MDAKEASQSKDLIQGKCKVSGRTLTVLYDSSATHSFVSRNYVTTLQLPISELPYNLQVSTPTNKLIRTSQVCMTLLFQIKGRTFYSQFDLSSISWS